MIALTHKLPRCLSLGRKHLSFRELYTGMMQRFVNPVLLKLIISSSYHPNKLIVNGNFLKNNSTFAPCKKCRTYDSILFTQTSVGFK